MKFVTKYRFIRSLHSHPFLYRNSACICAYRYAHKFKPDSQIPLNNEEYKISTLYVPSRYGGDMYQIIKPFIDVNYLEENMSKINESCCSRGIELDLQYTVDVLKETMSRREEHQKMVNEFQECQLEIKRLIQLELSEEAEALKQKEPKYIDALKSLKENVYNIEDISMPLIQKIPNILDPATPIKNNSVNVLLQPPVQKSDTPSHIKLANNLLEFTHIGPSAYFLKGPLAELEILIQVYFSEKLQKASYSPMSCVDFCKPFILEATGLDPYSYDHCIPLKHGGVSKLGKNYNLIGGASFEPFCAYLINMNTDFETLPFKYFAAGRHYEARNRHSTSPSLFSVVQSSRIYSAILTDEINEKLQFDSFLDTLVSSYSCLQIPFRTVDLAASNLNSTESRRIQLELWSPFLRQFVPVAHVSQRNDFVSKRLYITYGKQHTIDGYCHIVDGAVVDIPVLIGCLIENSAESNEIVNYEKINNLFNISE